MWSFLWISPTPGVGDESQRRWANLCFWFWPRANAKLFSKQTQPQKTLQTLVISITCPHIIQCLDGGIWPMLAPQIAWCCWMPFHISFGSPITMAFWWDIAPDIIDNCYKGQLRIQIMTPMYWLHDTRSGAKLLWVSHRFWVKCLCWLICYVSQLLNHLSILCSV